MHEFKKKFNNNIHNNLAIIYIKKIYKIIISLIKYLLTIKICDALIITTIKNTKDITVIVNNNMFFTSFHAS